jgi:hypothetical protein
LACFTLDGHQEPAAGVTLSLDWKIGIAAKDWDSVAKKEKIEVSYFNPPQSCLFLFDKLGLKLYAGC